MQPVRILLANHHPIIRSSLRILLERQSGFQVIGEAADGREAVTLVEYRRPEIVLLDVTLPRLTGLSAAREIVSKNGSTGILFVTTQTDEAYVVEAVKAGARGYVASGESSSDLVPAIEVVLAGGHFLSPEISDQLLADYLKKHAATVTWPERQQKLFSLLAQGRSDDEIALHFHSNAGNVRSDREKIKRALQELEMPETIVNWIGEECRVDEPGRNGETQPVRPPV